MRVLKLDDHSVRNIRRTHPAFAANPKLIARGTFGGVFESTDPTRVLKLTTDKSHVNYLVDGCSPQGTHKPVVHEDHGVIGETDDGLELFLLEMERLDRLQRGTPNGRLTQRIIRYVDRNSWYPARPEDMAGLQEQLASFMDELNIFISNFDCHQDAGWNNFMQRPDGTLVLSDPVFDRNLLCKSRLSQRQRQLQLA